MQVRPLSTEEVRRAIHSAAVKRNDSKGQDLKEMLGSGGPGMYMEIISGNPKPQVPLKRMRHALNNRLNQEERNNMQAAYELWRYGLRPTEEAQVDEKLGGYGARRRTPRGLRAITEHEREVVRARDRYWTETISDKARTNDHTQEWLRRFGHDIGYYTTPVLNMFAIDQGKGQPVPTEVLNRAFDMALFRTDVPREFNGLQFKQQQTDFVLGVLTNTGGGTAAIGSATKSIGTKPVVSFGTPGQKDYFIPPFVNGDAKGERYVATFMLTEKCAGTDAIGLMKKRAELVDVGGSPYFKISAQDSMFHTNAFIAGHGHCAVNIIDPETRQKLPSVMELELPFRFSDTREIRDRKVSELWDKGFEIAGDPQELIGIGGSTQTYWEAYDYLVPAEYKPGVSSVLGGLDGIGKGAEYIFGGLNKGRGGFINMCAFTAEIALNLSLDATCDIRRKERFPKLGDGTLSGLQPVKRDLAEMAIQVEMLKAYGELTSAWIDNFPDSNIIAEAAIGKAMASDILMEIAFTALKLHGGMGILKGEPIELLFRDSIINLLVEGVNPAMYQHGAGVSASPLLALSSSFSGQGQIIEKILGRSSKETGDLDYRAAYRLQRDTKSLSRSTITYAGWTEKVQGKSMQKEGIVLIETAQKEFKLVARAAAMFKIEELKKKGNPDDKKRIAALQLFCDREEGKKVTRSELLNVGQMYVDDAKIRIKEKYREDDELVKRYA